MKEFTGRRYGVRLHVNHETHTLHVRAADTLLHVLRDQLGLTGTKAGCENGDCGSCTVLVNGTPLNACLTLAVEAHEQPVTTVEGLRGSEIQKSFVEHWAFQCGFCTPGFICNAQGLIDYVRAEHRHADDELIKEWLQSNLCRCTSYHEIHAAVKSVLDDGEEC
ncbi:(2Fe-2S)-binding protein [Tumebacillus flagellatus]|uniref:(2Fe-2S)-binding protein n=1 Tax=Tumebacillus flagellatus TaxID=1157490 RepID=A0A074MHU2_9BACL|nr:(2Fe-2S)-binding protein [Tumebacillus flagellatus]KEO85257.1 (2Fe-2S)-binding protein [Tumebacillus flagellatus]